MIYELLNKICIAIRCATCNHEKPLVKDGASVLYCTHNKCETCDGNCCVFWRPRKRIVVSIIKHNRSEVKEEN